MLGLGTLQRLLKEFNVGYFNLYSKNKAAIGERVQRTIKERIHRFFTRHNTYMYVNILQDLTTSYNRSVYWSIKRTPQEMFDSFNRVQPRSMKCGDNTPQSRARYHVGDHIKISRDTSKMSRKGY